MNFEIAGQIEALITELVLMKNDIVHDDYKSADKRVLLLQRYFEHLQRQVFQATRNSGEVK